MPDPFDWRIVDRHLAGDSTPEDESALRAWLAADPRNAELLNAARVAADADDASWDVDRAWSRVSARLHEQGDPDVLPMRTHTLRDAMRRSRVPRMISAAGAVVAAAALAVVVLRPGAPRPDSPSPAPREVVASAAQQTTVTLDDGTRVVLNAASRLRYGDMARGPRDVELEGEAYFDVVHDESRPFRVHAQGSVTEDVGTRFVVRAYAEQPAVDVVVTHGAVSIRRDDVARAPTLVAVGHRARVERSGVVSVVAESDLDRWTEWTRGGIVLEGMSLADASRELGRRFGVRIEVRGDDLARRRVSARFHGEPLSRVLDALAVALDVRWTRDGDTVVFTRSER